MRCDQCKFWNGDARNRVKAGKLIFGECAKALQWWNSTEWDKEYIKKDIESFKTIREEGKLPRFVVTKEYLEEEENSRKLTKEAEGKKMFTMDASDYYSCLKTAPDFFCAHFEQLTKEE